jgi:N-hydroxyarylamine O-acetyltransferase
MQFDLPAYLDRIGWHGDPSVNLSTLRDLLRSHMSTIPFENLDVLLHRPVRLDLESLQQKMVGARRGGYCFEHATLFAAALEQLGFAPVRHSARVVLITPRDVAPRGHMFLTVPLAEGNFVVDPGFGALAPRIPIPLIDGAERAYDGEVHWMQRDGDYWIMRTRSEDKPLDCWFTTLERDNPVDFEMGNHYTSTYPASPFVNRIMVRALTADGRASLMNRDVTIRKGSETRRSQLADRAQLRTFVREHLGFDLPEIETLRVPSIPEWT